MMKALDENRHSNNGVKLATKHVILTSAINVHYSSSRKDVARALGVHHRKILVAPSRCTIIDDNGLALCSLSVKRKRTNGLPDLLKETVIDWWTFETCVNPKKSDVVCKDWRLWYMIKNLCTS
jgi:hypothetical protein